MKKTSLVLALALFLTTTIFAAQKGTPEYEKLKLLKQEQRATREAEKANPATTQNRDKWGSFWQKEGERSGLGNSGSRMNTWFKNLNPVPFFKDQQEQYDARKGGGVK